VKEIPFFPHQVVRELALAGFVLGVLIILAALLPAPLGEKATAGEVTAISPPWYLSPLFGFLVLWGALIGGNLSIAVAVPVLVLAVMLLLPFLDRGEAAPLRKRRTATVAGVVYILVILSLAYYAYTADFASYAELLP
jgi:quinol-cytochrome oxidoreductase complex cytochrome b subunit